MSTAEINFQPTVYEEGKVAGNKKKISNNPISGAVLKQHMKDWWISGLRAQMTTAIVTQVPHVILVRPPCNF